jgi:ketosteroid isomerase-like protein
MVGGLSYPLCVMQMKDIQKAALDEACVLAQNRAFYAALRDRDVDLMTQVWSQCAQVSCIHPGWQPLRGRELVMASWETILHHSNLPAIYPEEASVQLYGDTALVVCEESFQDGRLVATNIFVRESDDWRLLHHQAGPLNSDEDLDDDDIFDDGDVDSVVALDEHELTAPSGEQAPLHTEAHERADARSSGDDLLALYVPRRGPRRFIN